LNEFNACLLDQVSFSRFPNAPCFGGTKNGTCYTLPECNARGGENGGSCAAGFGVCCTITIGCGSTSSENCTYFDSDTVNAGGCTATVCPCGNNICQLRLDFVNFVISGPSSATNSVLKVKMAQVSKTGTKSVTQNSQCLTDTFSVTGPSRTPPTICGTNSGEHSKHHRESFFLNLFSDNRDLLLRPILASNLLQ